MPSREQIISDLRMEMGDSLELWIFKKQIERKNQGRKLAHDFVMGIRRD